MLNKKIAALRANLGLNQTEFGKEYGAVSHMSVSRWESGADQPPCKVLLKMAKAAGKDGAVFLDAAGVDSETIANIVANLEPRRQQITLSIFEGPDAQNVARKLKRRGADVVPVRVLSDPAAAGQPLFIDDKSVSSIMMVPNTKEYAPNPEGLIAVPIDGDSMSPLLMDGYTVVVDTSDNDRRRLYDAMVAARDPEGAVTIKWLRKAGAQEILLSQHTSPRHQPMIITGNDDWKIIGKVIWWIGKPPPK